MFEENIKQRLDSVFDKAKSKDELMNLRQTIIHEDHSLKMEAHKDNMRRSIIKDKTIKEEFLDRYISKVKLIETLKRKKTLQEEMHQLKRKSLLLNKS